VYENPAEIAMFEMRNYEYIKALVEKHDIPCDWRTLSVVHAYMSQRMFDHALEGYKSFHDMDPSLADLVTVVTPESSDPSLEDLRVSKAKGAFVQKHAASVWPYKFVAWVLEQLLAANQPSSPSFNLQTNTAATRLQKTDDGSWIVHTERGMIAAKKVLLTTNAYTSYLLPEFRDLITPVRGEMSSLLSPRTMKPGSDNPPLSYSYGFMGNGDQSGHQDDYLIQRPYSADNSGGELMFGGGRSYAANGGVGVSDDSSIDPPAASYLREQINIILDTKSDETELQASYEWSGIMGFSRDSKPWVGAVGDDLGLGGGDGLYICAGFTGHGMPNTCLSARAAVQLMLGMEQTEIDLPGRYWITKARLKRARTMETVEIADAAGTFGGDGY
jgi:glycine/D-amino acid oxidase-like deaminating enzyme